MIKSGLKVINMAKTIKSYYRADEGTRLQNIMANAAKQCATA